MILEAYNQTSQNLARIDFDLPKSIPPLLNVFPNTLYQTIQSVWKQSVKNNEAIRLSTIHAITKLFLYIESSLHHNKLHISSVGYLSVLNQFNPTNNVRCSPLQLYLILTNTTREQLKMMTASSQIKEFEIVNAPSIMPSQDKHVIGMLYNSAS